MDKDAVRLQEALERMNASRDFPHNTTPAARHVQMIAEALAAGEDVPALREDPKHVAESIVSVLTGFYEMSTELRRRDALSSTPVDDLSTNPVEKDVNKD